VTRAHAAGLAAALLFALDVVVAKAGFTAGLTPWDVTLLRFLGSAPFCLFWLWRHGLGGLAWWQVALLVVVAGAPYNVLLNIAIAAGSAGNAAVLNPGGAAIAGLLIGWLWLGEAPRRALLAGLALILPGLVLVSGGGLAGFTRGDALAALSGLSWGFAGALLRRWRIPGLTAAALIGAVSLAWVPLHLALFPLGTIADLPGEALWQAVWRGMVVGALAVALHAHAVATLGPVRASVFPPLIPALGPLFAALLLGEALTWWQLGGIALVVGGMLLGVRR
jgi:drug/metabolite transporter (DMT)-like permease